MWGFLFAADWYPFSFKRQALPVLKADQKDQSSVDTGLPDAIQVLEMKGFVCQKYRVIDTPDRIKDLDRILFFNLPLSAPSGFLDDQNSPTTVLDELLLILQSKVDFIDDHQKSLALYMLLQRDFGQEEDSSHEKRVACLQQCLPALSPKVLYQSWYHPLSAEGELSCPISGEVLYLENAILVRTIGGRVRVYAESSLVRMHQENPANIDFFIRSEITHVLPLRRLPKDIQAKFTSLDGLQGAWEEIQPYADTWVEFWETPPFPYLSCNQQLHSPLHLIVTNFSYWNCVQQKLLSDQAFMQLLVLPLSGEELYGCRTYLNALLSLVHSKDVVPEKLACSMEALVKALLEFSQKGVFDLVEALSLIRVSVDDYLEGRFFIQSPLWDLIYFLEAFEVLIKDKKLKRELTQNLFDRVVVDMKDCLAVAPTSEELFSLLDAELLPYCFSWTLFRQVYEEFKATLVQDKAASFLQRCSDFLPKDIIKKLRESFVKHGCGTESSYQYYAGLAIEETYGKKEFSERLYGEKVVTKQLSSYLRAFCLLGGLQSISVLDLLSHSNQFKDLLKLQPQVQMFVRDFLEWRRQRLGELPKFHFRAEESLVEQRQLQKLVSPFLDQQKSRDDHGKSVMKTVHPAEC